jgi:hypothetical protein
MLVLDALFDHIPQISSNVEIIRGLVQCAPIPLPDACGRAYRQRPQRPVMSVAQCQPKPTPPGRVPPTPLAPSKKWAAVVVRRHSKG